MSCAADFVVQSVQHLGRSPEPHITLGRDGHRFTRAWIVALPGVSGVCPERAKATQLDAILMHESLAHAVQDRAHDGFSHAGRRCGFNSAMRWMSCALTIRRR
jgi:hypothetical protein